MGSLMAVAGYAIDQPFAAMWVHHAWARWRARVVGRRLQRCLIYRRALWQA